MRVQLTIATAFSQGEGVYSPGNDPATGLAKAVPEEEWGEWQQDTLANRLQNGFVKWEPVPEDGKAPEVDPMTMNKEQLAQYILDQFQVTVDKRMNLQNMQQLLAAQQERARLVASANATAAAAAATKAANTPPAPPAADPVPDPAADPNAGATKDAP